MQILLINQESFRKEQRFNEDIEVKKKCFFYLFIKIQNSNLFNNFKNKETSFKIIQIVFKNSSN